MSRIGILPITVPEGVTIDLTGNSITVKGKNGELSLEVDPCLTIKFEDNTLSLERKVDDKTSRARHGLYRSLVNNLVVGVSEGFKKVLEIQGVGYRATLNGEVLELALGYSHAFYFVPPQGITIEVDTKTTKNPRIIISGADKAMVGQVSAKIRSLRKPEPYKGKGIRYLGEYVRKKAGKSAGR
ncbi:MAG: 50S ribosomal protein L6 [Candidatus Cyclonatronum sp.]|uniref:50S ribosomal protein L6 n=1 Tax=Cyclonatronum sp. TaxID=3024185 RepID=UPI0025C68074|nr:50S ribosomal protein L6 [Cyclonatronum sp.]MCC5935006.1 50S ribosomal protein L6 [Balneolales bacterium]MCH8487448.1 50S ribosomal protein L6 [Cyclonatronum sp.]